MLSLEKQCAFASCFIVIVCLSWQGDLVAQEFKAVDYKQKSVKNSIPKQETRILSPPYQIFQAHNDAGILNDLSDQIAIFSSSEVGSSYALYTQSLDNLQRCSTCEIKHYIPFFQLSPDEISELERHMTLFGILRQCCGLQMSKYEMLRLHGCNVTKYVDRPEYPHCERYSHNMSDIETAFKNSPIPYEGNSPKFNWARPGDCQRFQNEIVSEGLGFNGGPFPGCK